MIAGMSPPTDVEPSANARVTNGLFLVALATLLFEVLLTRIFSLTMWYHFAFMAISIAMFGMTVGAMAVFLSPRAFPTSIVFASLGRAALAMAVAIPVSVLAHIYAPFADRTDGVLALTYTFVLAALPFVFSGIFVCLALTRFPADVSRLYAADLLGAALGCVAVVVVLRVVDGITAVFVCGALAALAASMLLGGDSPAWRGAARALFLLSIVVIGSVMAYERRYDVAPFQVRWAKGEPQREPLLERWNSLSRIVVQQPKPDEPLAWSLGRGFTGAIDVRRFWLTIDAWAGTPLLEFSGDLAPLAYLRWDITNFVHHVVPDASVLIVGAGGGKDILGARLFGQKRITAVEINGDILDVVNGRYGSFTGHLDRAPAVELVHDEARSYLARQTDRHDIVQVSFIDTWAATAAGAFVLSENSLYTIEGWRVFLEHLTDRGILAVTRGMFQPEVYRLVGLARASLVSLGVRDPARHIVVVVNATPRMPESWGEMALVLVSRRPCDEATLSRIAQTAAEVGFDLRLRPGWAADENYAALAAGLPTEFERRLPLTLEPPTDDRPFFFTMLRMHEWFKLGRRIPLELTNQRAVTVLVNLLFVVSVLTVACIWIPLEARRREVPRDGSVPLLAFFGAIGLGFMMVEVATMQRLILFLGHPVYGLTVILFVLLAAGGLGAALTTRVPDATLGASGTWRLLGCLITLSVCGRLTPSLIAALEGAQTAWRIGSAALLLGAMGAFMGMAFPLGMRVAGRRRRELTPWLWGINGATSVVASVLAVIIAMGFGISVAYWAGVGCYGFAVIAFLAATRRPPGV
jgi:hypothetical protein